MFSNKKFTAAWHSEYRNAHTFRKALLLGRFFSLSRSANSLCKRDSDCNIETLRRLLLSETRRSQRMIDSITAPSIAFAAALGTMATFKPDLLTTTRPQEDPDRIVATIMARFWIDFLKSSTAPDSQSMDDDSRTPLTAVLDHAEDRYNETEFDRVARFVIHRLLDYEGPFKVVK